MLRPSIVALAGLAALNAPASGQMLETPGPGGIPIAPGRPVTGYTPGGIGPGGIEIAPGPAARNIPMYRIGPGGIPLVPRPDPRPDDERSPVRLDPGVPEITPQSLLLTINSRDAGPGRTPAPETPINSIVDLFAALRTCWEPPAREKAKEGVEMSVRFSFKRTGEVVAPPFVTYATPGIPTATRQVYREAIISALNRCVPLPLSESFSAAIAGRPLNVRYVDDRSS